MALIMAYRGFVSSRPAKKKMANGNPPEPLQLEHGDPLRTKALKRFVFGPK